ncbi:MAG: DNA polymerase III subunit delta [Cyclobacteriaceae bacterium]|nr:DNA polymerase III subunit delta [Cyclobacteriaceae bacterium]
MPKSPEEILKDLKENKYAPLYFLQGEEPFYIDKIADYIEKNALQEAEKSFNLTIVYGKDVKVQDVLNHARRFPMMALRQVVIVKEAQNVQDLGKEEGQKHLLDYIDNIVSSTILVFCHKHKSLDGRKALAKAIDKKSILVNTKKLYDNQLPPWIESYVSTKGHKISPKATQMLCDYIGNDLERMSNEIDKVLINYTESILIDDKVISKYVGISKDYNVFELQKSLIEKDIVKAISIVNYFKSNPKDHPIIPVIAILFSFFSKLLIAGQIPDKSNKGIASALGINPFFAKDYLYAMKQYSLVQIINAIHYLKEADLRSKGVDSGSIDQGEILRELVVKILS